VVALKIGVPVGDPWVIGEPETRQQKKMAEKKNGRKKQTILHQFSSLTTRQSTINQQQIR